MKTDMLRRTVKEAGGVRGISPEEEDYEGSAKRKASNLVWKSEDDESGELIEEEVPVIGTSE